jgi:hypothetical protein
VGNELASDEFTVTLFLPSTCENRLLLVWLLSLEARTALRVCQGEGMDWKELLSNGYDNTERNPPKTRGVWNVVKNPRRCVSAVGTSPIYDSALPDSASPNNCFGSPVFGLECPPVLSRQKKSENKHLTIYVH